MLDTVIHDGGSGPEQMLEQILDGLGCEVMESMPTVFACNCSKCKIEKVLISLGKKEIQDMIDDGQEIEVGCHFCNKKYIFSVEELKRLL